VTFEWYKIPEGNITAIHLKEGDVRIQDLKPEGITDWKAYVEALGTTDNLDVRI
jgi:hypothetical protein